MLAKTQHIHGDCQPFSTDEVGNDKIGITRRNGEVDAESNDVNVSHVDENNKSGKENNLHEECISENNKTNDSLTDDDGKIDTKLEADEHQDRATNTTKRRKGNHEADNQCDSFHNGKRVKDPNCEKGETVDKTETNEQIMTVDQKFETGDFQNESNAVDVQMERERCSDQSKHTSAQTSITKTTTTTGPIVECEDKNGYESKYPRKHYDTNDNGDATTNSIQIQRKLQVPLKNVVADDRNEANSDILLVPENNDPKVNSANGESKLSEKVR